MAQEKDADSSQPVWEKLKERGCSFAKIARELGVTRQHVARVARDPGQSKRVKTAIINSLGFSPWEMK